MNPMGNPLTPGVLDGLSIPEKMRAVLDSVGVQNELTDYLRDIHGLNQSALSLGYGNPHPANSLPGGLITATGTSPFATTSSGNSWGKSIGDRYSVRMAPAKNPLEDETIKQVLRDSDHYVQLLRGAMNNVSTDDGDPDQVNDAPNSREVALFAGPTITAEIRESACRLVFLAVIYRSVIGFCLFRHGEDSRQVDRNLSCVERIDAVINAMKVS
jgi:hypothetical protein